MGLDTNNPKWVGAWWIGFLLSGTFGMLLSFPLLAFPRSLPGHTKYAAERGKEVQAQTGQDETGKKPGLRDIWLSIRLLFTNWPFMFINIAAAADGILVAGFSTFMPKFIEYQFGYPASTAALYVGLIVVPTGGGATVVSGYIVRRFNLKVRGILKLCTGMSAVLCLFVLAFLMECGNSPFAGITLPYGQTAAQTTSFIGKRLESGCNVDCACAEQDYFPMCGRDNVMYFSPCYAGCSEVFQDGNTKLYGNCSCVSYTLTEEDIASSRTHMGEFGKCHYNCSWFKYFMVLFGIMIVLIFGVTMPSLTATLRCIPDHQRSFGLGIQWIVARCLGSIPGPIMFGKMIDLACLVWQKRCDGTGSCFFYDNHKMSVNLLILAAVFCVTSTIAFGLALLLYKVKDTGEEQVEINMEDPKEVEIKPYTIQAESQDIESTDVGVSNGVSQSAPYYDNYAMENS